MTGNGGPPAGSAPSGGVAAAVADALAEHDRWLDSLRRALICGLPPDKQLLDTNSEALCQFGAWFERHSRAGMLDGDLFVELGRTHGEVHEAARHLAGRSAARKPVAVDEYDALASAFDSFRAAIARVQEAYGLPEDVELSEDPEIAALQSRLTMLAELEREWERSSRANSPVCLVMVRPNGLRGIEEQFGSLGIDRVVAGLAARLYARLRPYDAVYRYGRAEFLICLPGTDIRQAGGVTKRLCEAVDDAPFALSESVETKVSARFGVAASDARASVQEVLDRASRAANMAGTAEGERIAIWSPTAEN